MSELTAANARNAKLVATLLDTLPALNRAVLRRLISTRTDLKVHLTDNDALIDHLYENVAGVFHPTGTCRMGLATDIAAVVDCAGKVHGVERLRVADASIMPTVPSGNTHLPTIMIAEKIAADIKSTR